MKMTLIGAVLLSALAAEAEAKCSLKSLNGNWVMLPGLNVTARNGDFRFTETGERLFKVDTFSSSTCRGKGNFILSNTPYAMTIASESIPATVAPPNQLMLTIFVGSDSGGMIMRRK